MIRSPMAFALRAMNRLFTPEKPLTFFGHEAMIKLADLMMRSGSKRPLIVTNSFLLQNGMLDTLLAFLKQEGCDVSVFEDIVPNPTFAVVGAGISAIRTGQCDSVFAVGGGSAIDAAKVMAAASTNKKSLQKLAGILKVRQTPLPLYVVATTSGTGSEVTTAAVISDTTTHKKNFFVDPKYLPIAAAFDTDILTSLPGPMTAGTGMDALTHAIESFTSLARTPATERDAATAVRLIVEFLPIAYRDPENARAREMVALGSFLAGYAFTRTSLGYVHAISHQISAHYNTPHGLANAVLLPRVLRFNEKACGDRFATLERVLTQDSNPGEAAQQASAFIHRIDALADSVGIPALLEDVQQSDFAAIARDALAEARSSYAVPKKMRKSDVATILDSVVTGNRSVHFG
ncbi:iron-containing alcohol dehydrogenase [Shimia sp. MMG029]|uniref:iron-containing alcohol dehydrogenase n=1 Tax=Shimia sp. MMG029 TaxID=3021978 RepID=UPI0022FDE158|nr:iron-containing alcohol dehydrogenase [Shimia sp. MMG029]MDA5558494.1 iron-containing alcohol dehydrogenase [Shimia sp. MMG029]